MTNRSPRRAAWRGLLATTPLWLGACVSVGLGGDVPAQAHYRLHDRAVSSAGGGTPARLPAPLVPALVIQPLPADATADTISVAYSPRPNVFGFYQFASWSERPVRQVPRLLQQRLEARGIAQAVGLVGEPLRADWLLTLSIETLHHDTSTVPGSGRVTLSAELFDRRDRSRVARQRFDASVPAASADAPAATAAISQAMGQTFDALVPWLEAALPPAVAKAAAVVAR